VIVAAACVLPLGMTDTIEITSKDGHRFGAFIAGAADLPRGIVLIDSLPGDTPLVRRMAARVAAFGYRVIAPNLVDRVERNARLSYMPFEFARSQALRDRLEPADVMLDVAASCAVFGHERVGILGFGWGGAVAWHTAAIPGQCKAAACFYGEGIAKARDEILQCPVHLAFGEGDHLIRLSDVELIRRAQPKVEIAVYPGSHDFACEERELFSASAWEDARETMLAFFRRNL
jgi:carboxymethylenebutenolidase